MCTKHSLAVMSLSLSKHCLTWPLTNMILSSHTWQAVTVHTVWCLPAALSLSLPRHIDLKAKVELLRQIVV